eukprot:4332665-Heterocapsa_arctica.AAC.1
MPQPHSPSRLLQGAQRCGATETLQMFAGLLTRVAGNLPSEGGPVEAEDGDPGSCSHLVLAVGVGELGQCVGGLMLQTLHGSHGPFQPEPCAFIAPVCPDFVASEAAAILHDPLLGANPGEVSEE